MKKIAIYAMAAGLTLAGLTACGLDARYVSPTNQAVITGQDLNPEQVLKVTETTVQVSWMGYVFLMPDLEYELGSFCMRSQASVSDIYDFMGSKHYTKIKVLSVDDRVLGYSVGRVKVTYYPQENKVKVERPQPRVLNGEITWDEYPASPWILE